VAFTPTVRTIRSRDITEAFPINVGNPSLVSDTWTNTNIQYDCAIGGLPFFFAISNDRQYKRQTAPYKKEQFDNSREPGEQSLTGWWIRSQSSFHRGQGITFFDPSAGEEVDYRFKDSQGVDVWTKGQVTLLKKVDASHVTIASSQKLRSIRYGNTDAVLSLDGHDVDKLFARITVSINNKALTSNVATLTTTAAHGLAVGMEINITGVDATFNGEYRVTGVPTTTTFTYAKTATDVTSTAVSPVGTGTSDIVHFIDYNSGTEDPVYAICDDGATAYWVTNDLDGGTNKAHVYKKALTADSTTADTLMFNINSYLFTAGKVAMDWVKGRIILAADNKVYELTPTTSSIPTPIYTHPTTDYTFTSVAESGAAIYVAGYSGVQSSIYKFTLSTAGAITSLSSAVVAAEMPRGEIIYSMKYYLGYMLIGTSKGIRAATVSVDDGSISYGPLIVETAQPVYDFAFRDRFVWATTGVNANAGLVRLDLGEQISPLRFAYANDVLTSTTNNTTTSCAFLGTSNRIAFTAANSFHFVESLTEYITDGYLQTGFIRYGTLEPKNFKRVRARGDYTFGGMIISPVALDNTVYETAVYNTTYGSPEINIENPQGSQEYIGLKFSLSLYEEPGDTTSTLDTSGPIFKGYQLRSLPATPRNHLIELPLYCFDVETDKNNVRTGYDGRAWERIQILEDLDSAGDEIIFQDFRTGEQISAIVESVAFNSATPPSGDYSGFGGYLTVLIRETS